MMNRGIVMALLVAGEIAGQQPQVQTPVSTDDRQRELEQRTLLKAKMVREHSDASGKIRPDLRNAAIAHMQRMKVATHIGPMPTAPQDKPK